MLKVKYLTKRFLLDKNERKQITGTLKDHTILCLRIHNSLQNQLTCPEEKW